MLVYPQYGWFIDALPTINLQVWVFINPISWERTYAEQSSWWPPGSFTSRGDPPSGPPKRLKRDNSSANVTCNGWMQMDVAHAAT